MDMRLFKKIKMINFVTFFSFWTIFFFALADKPPPAGFYWLMAILFVYDILLYIYLDDFIESLVKKRRGVFLRNLLYFSLGGLVFCLILSVIVINIVSNVGNEGYLISAYTTTAVGFLNGLCFYFFNKLLLKKYNLRMDPNRSEL
ncbi:hypothetical protein [Paenibacillus sinensis]|uniref:hypothetical protein n=1 Tax=Paenibacillus sinensis TaxID=2834413 RepID=UPI001CA86339|nr:hypothetical protein [Paenibacillus sinensis]